MSFEEVSIFVIGEGVDTRPIDEGYIIYGLLNNFRESGAHVELYFQSVFGRIFYDYHNIFIIYAFFLR